MNTREEAIKYGLSFANTYVEAPFRNQNSAASTGEGK